MEEGPRRTEKGERNRWKIHQWKYLRAGAWGPGDSRDPLPAVDNYFQTFVYVGKK